MRKLVIFVLTLICTSFGSYAQSEDGANLENVKRSEENEVDTIIEFGKSDLKLNLYHIVFSTLDITYERLFNDNTAVGLAAAYCFRSKNYHADPSEFLWSFMPHYRLYFGKKMGAGLFLEANAHVAQTRKLSNIYYYDSLNSWRNERTYKDNLGYGAGFAIGAKFLNAKGLVGEVFGGAGRYLNSGEGMPGFYPRAGVVIGKRF